MCKGVLPPDSVSFSVKSLPASGGVLVHRAIFHVMTGLASSGWPSTSMRISACEMLQMHPSDASAFSPNLHLIEIKSGSVNTMS